MELTKRLRVQQIEVIEDLFRTGRPYKLILDVPLVARSVLVRLDFDRPSSLQVGTAFGNQFGIGFDISVPNRQLELKLCEHSGIARVGKKGWFFNITSLFRLEHDHVDALSMIMLDELSKLEKSTSYFIELTASAGSEMFGHLVLELESEEYAKLQAHFGEICLELTAIVVI